MAEVNCSLPAMRSDVSSYGESILSPEETERLTMVVSLMACKSSSFEQVMRMVNDAIAGQLTREQALLQLEMKI